MQNTDHTLPIKFDPTATGPLDGIRVLDLTRLVAGNMLSLQLADFGADVIKVEPPSGDPLRDWRDGGHELHWKTYARNKRSIVLNLRHAGAKAALLRLVATADVFMENFRPGTLEEMGLGPAVLLKINPALVVVRVSGFGQTGPYAPLPGFGTLVEAMSGFAARTGFPDREPVLPPLALADMIAGLYGAFAVMTALRARDRGGQGQMVDLSLLEAMFSVLGPEAAIYRQTGVVKERTGSGSQTSAPRNVYRCRDGRYVALSGSTESMARRIFEVIGRAHMSADARFSSNSARVKHRSLVDAEVGDWFAARTRRRRCRRCAKQAPPWGRSTPSRTLSRTGISVSVVSSLTSKTPSSGPSRCTISFPVFRKAPASGGARQRVSANTPTRFSPRQGSTGKPSRA